MAERGNSTGAKNWMPRELGCFFSPENDINVTLATPENQKAIAKDLIDGIRVVITLIVRGESELLAVCLTSAKCIYLIRPGIKDEVDFFKKLLIHQDLEFYIVAGLWGAYWLKKVLDIKLEDLAVINIESLDMYISLNKSVNIMQPNDCTVSFVHDHIKPKWLHQEQLIEKYCQVKADFVCTEDELEAILVDPCCIKAKNGIKKRAAMAHILLTSILNIYNEMINQTSKNIYSMAKLSDKLKEDYERHGSSSYADLCYWLGKSDPVA